MTCEHENINVRLGKLRPWKWRRCVDCGRGPTAAVLNFEGGIHHGERLRCIDRKSCERLKRRINRCLSK